MIEIFTKLDLLEAKKEALLKIESGDLDFLLDEQIAIEKAIEGMPKNIYYLRQYSNFLSKHQRH